MESCWGSGSGTVSYTTTGCAASLSAQLTVPPPTGLISRVSSYCLDYVQLFPTKHCFDAISKALQCFLQNRDEFAKIASPLSQSCAPPLCFQPCPPSIRTPAPYSIRNLSESSLTQYELDSKSCISLYVSLPSLRICLHVVCCIVLAQITPFV